jgi:CHASE3 domain sensor protein
MAVTMIRKIALPAGSIALLALITWNAYLALRHVNRMRDSAALTGERSMIQAGISAVLRDLTDMETGQRGFLLTADFAYLQPYTDAKGRIAADFADLRLHLAHSGERERSLESQVESLAASKQAEMERSISLRQRGYRHRALVLVNSNEGFEYMDKARNLLSSLSAAETITFAALETASNTGLSKGLTEIIAANAALFLLTACLFTLVRSYGRALERDAARSRDELAIRDLQLAKLTSALANQARFKTSAIEANARLLLQEYGGFLPRQGHECAELIREASAQMERLRQDLVGIPESSPEEKPALDFVA